MIRVRNTDEWVGLLIIGAIAVSFVAMLQAGVLRDWFKPTAELRLVLPAGGVAGLAAGGDVEVLGTKAGVVRRVVLEPNQQMYALLEIDEQATPFVRRDSTAVIRRRFGVAGAAFVDITRGTGEEMDWSYAVIEATTERAPTDNISALIDEVRKKVFPILDNAGRATNALAEIIERINRGEGNVGRLLVDQTLMQQAETIVKSANKSVADLNEILVQVENVTREVSGPEGVPALVDRSNKVMRSLDRISKEIDEAAKSAPGLAQNAEETAANLPALLTQLQVTLQELDRLSAQLRASWLLGGQQQPQAQEPKTFSPSQVVP
jgi:phospholipid/cholesterol/gamma-HCH transport system substrate-binding protein